MKSLSVVIINLLLLLLIIIKNGYTFNLSPIPNHKFSEPLLNFVNKKVQSSYFGYQINLRKTSVIIAAPRAQSTIWAQREFNETGALYKCKIGTAECTPFVVDDLNGAKPFQGFTKLIKSHQWLGASMDGGSNDEDLLIVCAPNAISANEEQHSYHGVCYLSENTINDRISQPSKTNVKELHPLREKEYQEIIGLDFNGQNRVYSLFEYGQMGHSVQMSRNLKDILIGAPGVYVGSGSIVQYKSVANEKVNLINKFGNMEIHFPNTIASYSYFGYAVAIGNFIGKTRITYAASAPHSGFVNIFEFQLNNKIQSNYKREIRIAYKMFGEQLGEYFGYALLAEDFNGDQIDDLAVGAPLHAKKKMYENGKVYVYVCKNKKCPPQDPLFSDYIGNGRFGMTLGKIGDLNHDGYNDLAVGAPYEENGKVYIFLGGRNGLATKPSQIITSPDSNIHTFGLGLSKGVDIDSNQCKDFAIGAPNSEGVYIYKSYPVIKINTTITPVSSKVGVTDRSTKFTVCASYSTKLKGFSRSIPIMLTTHIDSQLKRATFHHTTSTSDTIEMMITQTMDCRIYQIKLSHTLHDPRPIVLQANYRLKKDFRNEVQFCKDCVAVNPSDQTFVQSKIAISTGCKGTFCMADLKITSNITDVQQTHTLGKPEIINVEYTITNFGETAYFPQISIQLSQLTQFTKIPSYCDLSETTLNCDLDNSMPLLNERQTKFIVSINPIELIGHELIIKAEALSASNETTPNNNIVTDTIELVEYNIIEIIGKSQPTQISFEQIIDETLNITHEFEIINYGYSVMKEITFTAYIPQIYNQEFNVIGPILYATNRYGIEFEKDEAATGENVGSSHEDTSTIDENPRTKREILSDIIAEALQSKIVHIPHHRSRYFNCSANLEMHACLTSTMKFTDFTPKEKIKIIYNITVNLGQLHQILDATHNILLIEIIPNLEKTNDPEMQTFTLSAMNTLTAIELIHKEKTPLLWIVVSIIVGILVLAGLIYLLNRLGFFRRALKKEIVKIKRETMQLRQSMALRQSMMLPPDENSHLGDENDWDS